MNDTIAWLFLAVVVSTATDIFFFSSRRRHTRCLSDWSSDVCSSDLLRVCGVRAGVADCVYLHWAGSGAVAGDDDSIGCGEVYVLHGGGGAGDAGKNEPRRSGIWGGGFDVGGVVWGVLFQDNGVRGRES